MFEVVSILMFMLGLVVLAAYVRDYHPAASALLVSWFHAVRDTGAGKVRLGIILQMLAGFALVLDIAGDACLVRWGRGLQAAATYASGVQASLNPSLLFVEGSPVAALLTWACFS